MTQVFIVFTTEQGLERSPMYDVEAHKKKIQPILIIIAVRNCRFILYMYGVLFFLCCKRVG